MDFMITAYLWCEEKLKLFPTSAETFPALVLSALAVLFKNRPVAFSSWDKARK